MPRSQDILSNPNRVALTKKIKKSNILGENPPSI